MSEYLAESHKTEVFSVSEEIRLWVSTWTEVQDGTERYHVQGTFQRLVDNRWQWDNDTSVSFNVREAWRKDYLLTDLAYNMWADEVGGMNVPIRFFKTHRLDRQHIEMWDSINGMA